MSNQYKHFDMPDATANYGLPFDIITFFGLFMYTYELLYLHQTFTDYVKKVSLCKHLWLRHSSFF